jgi:hypothetical protein
MKFHTPAALAGLLLLSSCDTDILNDPSFDVWCGDTLCSWEVDAGSIEKVPTWHSADYGVSLVGDEVILSQRIEATQADIQCIEFRLLADIDDDATVSLRLDFLDDGTDEYSHPMTSDDFQESTYHITPPSWFQGVRFILHKEGSGSAVLGQIRALSVAAEECLEAPLTLNDRPDGAPCESASQCTGGACPEVDLLSSSGGFALSTCSSCQSSDDCTEACGVTASEPESQSFLTCEPAGSAALGEHCATAEECGTGVCADGQCAECASSADCGDGETCSEPDPLSPRQCIGDPRPSGAACLSDADCDSGVCQGDRALKICDPDGRACSEDTDCPWHELGAVCVNIGQHDGTCQ